jgi:hypothetical protein
MDRGSGTPGPRFFKATAVLAALDRGKGAECQAGLQAIHRSAQKVEVLGSCDSCPNPSHLASL